MPEPDEAWGLVPGWTRIVLHLPINNTSEVRAGLRIQNHLIQYYRGATCSLLWPPAFEGFWVPNGRVIRDFIATLTIDVQSDAQDIDDDLEIIRLISSGEYLKVGRPQQTLWIIVHPISLFSKIVQKTAQIVGS